MNLAVHFSIFWRSYVDTLLLLIGFGISVMSLKRCRPDHPARRWLIPQTIGLGFWFTNALLSLINILNVPGSLLAFRLFALNPTIYMIGLVCLVIAIARQRPAHDILSDRPARPVTHDFSTWPPPPTAP